MHEKIQQAHDVFIEKMGFLGSLFGFSKLIGQIYGVLYLSPNALSLNDLMERLHVSKGSISTNIRELEKWGGCRKVWVKGDRKDFYEAEVNFRNIINKRLIDAIKRRISTIGEMTELSREMINDPKNGLTAEDKELLSFYDCRIGKINKFRNKLNFIFNTATRLL